MSEQQIQEILRSIHDLRESIEAKLEGMKSRMALTEQRAAVIESGCVARKEACSDKFKTVDSSIKEIKGMFWWIMTSSFLTLVAVLMKMIVGK